MVFVVINTGIFQNYSMAQNKMKLKDQTQQHQQLLQQQPTNGTEQLATTELNPSEPNIENSQKVSCLLSLVSCLLSLVSCLSVSRSHPLLSRWWSHHRVTYLWHPIAIPDSMSIMTWPSFTLIRPQIILSNRSTGGTGAWVLLRSCQYVYLYRKDATLSEKKSQLVVKMMEYDSQSDYSSIDRAVING